MDIRNIFKRKSTKKAAVPYVSADEDRLIAALTDQAELAAEGFRQIRQEAKDLDAVLQKAHASATMMLQLQQVVIEAEGALELIQRETTQVCGNVRMVASAGKRLHEAGQHFNINNATHYLDATLRQCIEPTKAVHVRCRAMLNGIVAEQERIERVSDPRLQRDLPVRAHPLRFKAG